MSNIGISQPTLIKPFEIVKDISLRQLPTQHLHSTRQLKDFELNKIFVKNPFSGIRSGEQFCTTALTMKGKIPQKLENLHSKLYCEAEKIQKWKISTEVEQQQKGKKLNEAYQTIDSQRKVLLELQLQNESLSMQLSEELQNRKDILQRIQSTRELCFALKNHFDGLQESLNFCYGAKEEFEMVNEQRYNAYECLEKKFAVLHLSHDEKIKTLNCALISKETKIKELEIQYNEKIIDENNQISGLKQKTDQQLVEITTMMEHTREIQNEKLELENKCASLKNLITELLAAEEELKAQLQECKQEYQENTNTLTHCLNMSNQKLDSEKERSEALCAKNEECISLIEELKQNQVTLEEEVNKVRHDNNRKNELEEEICKLNGRLCSLLHEKEDLDNKLKEISSDKEDIRSNLMKISAEKEHLNENLMKIASEKDQTIEKLENIVSEKSKELENLLNKKDEEFLKVENERLSIEESYSNLLNKMQELRMEKEEELCDMGNNLKKLEELIASKEEAYKEMEVQYYKLNNELVEEQRSHKYTSKEWNQTKEQIETLKNDIATKDSKVVLLESRIVLLESNISFILKEKADEKELHIVQMREVTQLLDKVQKDYCKDMVLKQNELQNLQNQIDKLQDQLRFGDYERGAEIEQCITKNVELKSKGEKTDDDKNYETPKQLNIQSGCLSRKRVTFKNLGEIDTSASDSVEIEMAVYQGTENKHSKLKVPSLMSSSKKLKSFPAAKIAPSRRMSSKILDGQGSDVDFKDTGTSKRKKLDGDMDELFLNSGGQNDRLYDSTNSYAHYTSKNLQTRKFFKTPRNLPKDNTSSTGTGLSWFDFDSTYGLFS